MRKCILLTLVLLASITAFSQDFSNKGKDFYLCFPNHVPSSGNATLSIFITSDKASSGTITMPNGAFAGTFNIGANGLQEILVNWNSNIHISNNPATDETTNETITRVLKKSIRIKVDAGKPAVVAYAQQWAGARSAATLLLPANVLGKKYFAISANQQGAPGGNPAQQAKSQFQVIAVKDNTVVQITPMKNGAKGTAFTVTLPLAGDMIQYQSPDPAALSQDLTGTLIESIASGSGGCLPIAVFSGSSNVTLGTPTCTGNSWDPLWQQLYPSTTWGKNFGFMPFEQYFQGDPFRVMAAEDNTTVSFNGSVVAVLNAGEIYPAGFTPNPPVIAYNSPTYISADKPICVAQYAPADVCSGQPGPTANRVGDPDMVILNPIEQNISDITIFTSNRQAITRPWINVLLQTVAVPSFRINGLIPTTAWQPFPTLPGYSYLRHLFPTGANSYRLTADSGFNAICYGLGNVESYAYSAGTYIKDLNSPGVFSINGIENNKVCVGENFKIKIPLPYLADSIYWDLSGLPGGYPNVWTYYPPDAPDSVRGTVLKPIYWYSLPTNFSVAVVGTFPIKVTTYSQNTDGCGSEQDVEFEIEITGPPVSEFTWIAPRCPAETVQFNDASVASNPFYKWWWDFGDPTSGALNNAITANPTHVFTGLGLFTVRYVNITTPGCVSDTITHIIDVPAMPTATIGGTTTVCINSSPMPDITFTGSGSGPYTFTYTIDPGPGPGLPQTINSSGPIVTIQAPTLTAGTFIYRLTNVAITGSTLCTQNIVGQSATVIVNPNHAIAPALGSGLANQTRCINNLIDNITYDLLGGATGATVTGLPAGVTSSVTGTVLTIAGTPNPVFPGASAIYNYTVTTTGNSCVPPAQAFGSITVNADHVLTWSNGPTAQTVCINTPISNVQYTIDGGATGVMITGLPTGVTFIVTGNTVTISGASTTPILAPVTYTYIINTTGNTCVQAPPLSGTITVNPLPTATAAAAVNTEACQNDAVLPGVTFTGANGTRPYTFTYTINGALPVRTISTTALSNSVTVLQSTAVANTFTYKLISVTDGSVTACSQLINVPDVAIKINPLPTATISGAKRVCINSAPVPIVFTGAGGTLPYTFRYRVGVAGPLQTVITTGASSSVTLLAPTTAAGLFDYILESVQDGSSTACTQNQTGNALIDVSNIFPNPAFSYTPSVCLPNAVVQFQNLSNISDGSGMAFSWAFGDGSLNASTFNATHQYGSVGPFNVILTATSDAGCVTATPPVLLNNIHPQPKADFSFSNPAGVCIKDPVTLTDLSDGKDGVITQWFWDLGDGTKPNTNPVTHLYLDTITYNVTLYTVNNIGCNSDTITRM